MLRKYFNIGRDQFEAVLVGFDNERGKGDHCHLDGNELPYTFVNVDLLIQDFIREVESRR